MSSVQKSHLYIIIISLSLVIVTFIVHHFKFLKNEQVSTIMRLEDENKFIQNRNNVLLGQIDSIRNEIIFYDTIYNIIITNDSIYREKIDSLQNRIKQIKTLYEISLVTPNYINSDTIKKYFSSF